MLTFLSPFITTQKEKIITDPTPVPPHEGRNRSRVNISLFLNSLCEGSAKDALAIVDYGLSDLLDPHGTFDGNVFVYLVRHPEKYPQHWNQQREGEDVQDRREHVHGDTSPEVFLVW